MKILAIGDVFSECGVKHTQIVLKDIINDEAIDFVIANGENASGSGISIGAYDELIDAGVDFITLGNHAYGKKDVYSLFETQPNIIRPLNYGDKGEGSKIVKCKGKKIGIINIMGRVGIDESINSPFDVVSGEIKKISEKCDFIIVDFHAEATSEKKAMMYYLDKKVSILFGTHTHIQTSDAQITKNGLGYITDLGMTGAIDSILGVDKDVILDRFVNNARGKFTYAYSDAMLSGCIFEIDENTNKCTNIKTINVR